VGHPKKRTANLSNVKRSLAFIIISILLAQCSSEPEQTVVNVASDIIPKSQVVWCNNEVSKLIPFVDAFEDDGMEGIADMYSQEQALDLQNSYQYFTTTSNLFYPKGPLLLNMFSLELNTNLEEFPEAIISLERGADFCTTWYQAQNS